MEYTKTTDISDATLTRIRQLCVYVTGATPRVFNEVGFGKSVALPCNNLSRLSISVQIAQQNCTGAQTSNSTPDRLIVSMPQIVSQH